MKGRQAKANLQNTNQPKQDDDHEMQNSVHDRLEIQLQCWCVPESCYCCCCCCCLGDSTSFWQGNSNGALQRDGVNEQGLHSACGARWTCHQHDHGDEEGGPAALAADWHSF
jgi:hypothetical protein